MSNNTSNIAIKVENLGKRYYIHHEKKESYATFQDVLINAGRKIITFQNHLVLLPKIKYPKVLTPKFVILLCILGIYHFRKTEKTFADVI